MLSPIFRRSLLAAVVLVTMAPFAFPAPARAQSDDEAQSKATEIDSPVRARIEEARRAAAVRKARAAGKYTQGKQAGDPANTASPANAATVARYPGATRAEPPAKATKAATPKLQKIIEAYNGGNAAAVPALADAVIADPQANDYDHAFAARMAGVALVNTDKARAAQYLKQAVQFNGLNNNDHYESMLVLAQLQLQAEQYAEALPTIDRFLTETHSQEPEQLVLKGNALYRLKRYPEAAAILKQAIAASPQAHPDWQQLLMGIYYDTNQPAEAAKVADALAAKSPNDKNAQMNLASVYMQSGQSAKASAILEKLRASGQLTDERDYRNLYSLYFNTKGSEKDAVAVINEGLQKGILKPDYQTYSDLAQGYYFSEQPALAIAAYRKAAPLAPDGETYLNLAKALSNQGQTAEAKQAALQALAKGVKNTAEAKRLAGQKAGK